MKSGLFFARPSHTLYLMENCKKRLLQNMISIHYGSDLCGLIPYLIYSKYFATALFTDFRFLTIFYLFSFLFLICFLSVSFLFFICSLFCFPNCFYLFSYFLSVFLSVFFWAFYIFYTMSHADHACFIQCCHKRRNKQEL